VNAQNAQNRAASVVIGIAPNSAHNAGYLRVPGMTSDHAE